MLLMVMVGNTDWATNEYQTSPPAVPQAVVTAGFDTAALFSVPATGLQVADDVSDTALLHRSFAGGSVTQIEKSQRPAPLGASVFEYMRI